MSTETPAAAKVEQPTHPFIGLYKGKQYESHAVSMYAAQKEIAKRVGARHEYDVSVYAATETEPLAAAIEIFEQIRIKPSQNVFIFGAGKLGLLISQVFRLNGCDYKTFDPNPLKVKKAQEMGLNAFPLDSLKTSEFAEVCVDCTGKPEGIGSAMAHLYPRGRLVLKTTIANPEKIDLNQIVINEFQITGSRCGPFKPALNLLSQGLIDPIPLITQTFRFRDIMEAFECAANPESIKVVIEH